MTARTRSQPLERSADAAPLPAPCSGPLDDQLRWGAANAAWRLLRSAWYFVRQVSGDDAYERYREHMLQAHAGQTAMTRAEHYKVRTEQKWNRVTRCC
jgi:uncharacterized short protein YbdD (DUF466 family)